MKLLCPYRKVTFYDVDANGVTRSTAETFAPCLQHDCPFYYETDGSAPREYNEKYYCRAFPSDTHLLLGEENV